MDYYQASQPPGPPPYAQPSPYQQPPPQPPSGEISTAIICLNCETGLIPGDTVSHAGGASYFCGSCTRHAPQNAQQVHLRLSDKTPSRDTGSTQCDSCMREIKKGRLAWHCGSCFMSKKLCERCWRKKRKHCRHVKRGEVRMVRIERMSRENKKGIAKVVGKVVGEAIVSG